MNVTLRILDVFVTRWIFFFENGILINDKKNSKNLYGFWKINKFILNDKSKGYLITYWKILLFE